MFGIGKKDRGKYFLFPSPLFSLFFELAHSRSFLLHVLLVACMRSGVKSKEKEKGGNWALSHF